VLGPRKEIGGCSVQVDRVRTVAECTAGSALASLSEAARQRFANATSDMPKSLATSRTGFDQTSSESAVRESVMRFLGMAVSRGWGDGDKRSKPGASGNGVSCTRQFRAVFTPQRETESRANVLRQRPRGCGHEVLAITANGCSSGSSVQITHHRRSAGCPPRKTSKDAIGRRITTATRMVARRAS
jgi:hypothetical protein